MKNKKMLLVLFMGILLMYGNFNINAIESTNKTKTNLKTKAAVVYPATIESIFKDQNLADYIAVSLNKNRTDLVEKSDIDVFNYIQPQGYGIKSLEGIEELSNLQGVDALMNEITDISNVDWTKLPKLERIYLDYNSITSLDGIDFSNSSKLMTISLYNNQITSLKDANFNGLSGLKYLTVAKNKISNLDGVNWNGLTSLEELTLTENQISELATANWSGLDKLKVLTIDYNQITTLDNVS